MSKAFTGMTLIKQRKKRHYPIKATKKEVLRFIRNRDFVTVHDLVERFGYKYKGAEKRLYTPTRQGLITHGLKEDNGH